MKVTNKFLFLKVGLKPWQIRRLEMLASRLEEYTLDFSLCMVPAYDEPSYSIGWEFTEKSKGIFIFNPEAHFRYWDFLFYVDHLNKQIATFNK